MTGNDYIPITQEIIDTLLEQQKRTGFGSSEILKGRDPEKPMGLNSGMVGKWLRGKIKSAKAAHVDYVMRKWKELPDNSINYIELTAEKRSRLREKHKETGLSQKKLLSNRSDIPDGLTPSKAGSYIHPSSIIKTIRHDYYDYLIRIYDEHKGQGYTEITPELLKSIQDEIDRTGVKVPLAIKLSAGKKPIVNANTVLLWQKGAVQRAEKPVVDFILNAYAKIPDKANSVAIEPLKSNRKSIEFTDIRYDSLELIPDTALKKLDYYRQNFKLLPSLLFKVIGEPPPAGLNSFVIKSWLYGGTKRANPEYLNWVLKHCEEYERSLEK